MSRMDRYKDIHEESQQASKQSLFQRKRREGERRSQNNQEPSFYEENTEQPVYNISKKNKKKKQVPYNQGGKPKKRKKHRFLRFIIKLLLLLLIYSGFSFFLGQFVAKMDTDTPQQMETFNGFTSSSGANNILLIGNDSRDGETARADTIMVLQLDGPAKKPKLISFMRDTLVTIPDVGENKINAAYAYGGAELVRTTLSQNFGIEAKYYMTVDFKTFEKTIDTLFPSGVYIDAEKDMSKYIEVAIEKGPQKMDGLTLLQYARFRMDKEGDFGRVRRQQQVMNGIFSEMKNPLAILKLPYAAGKVLGYTSTDLSTAFLLRNTFSIAKGAGGVDRLSIPVENSWNYGESYAVGSYIMVDSEMNRQAIHDFLAK